MSKQYKLQYLPLFWDDLNAALRYIRDVLKSSQAAELLLDDVEEAVLQLQFLPEAAPLYKEKRQRLHPYRWIAVKNYLIFFVVIDEVVEVRRFIYNARDIPRLLD